MTRPAAAGPPADDLDLDQELVDASRQLLAQLTAESQDPTATAAARERLTAARKARGYA